VPAAFVFLDALPLTRNGKVDRRALPAPSVAAQGRAAAPAAPRSEVERAIAAVWAEVLGLPEVGVEDNFFDLGGHSLLLVQVLSRLRKAFDAELAMVDLFRHPTVSGLAAHVARQREAGDGLEDRYSRADQRRQASGRRRQFVQGRRGQKDKELADVTS
jgi:acyl carrier protein